MIAIAAGVVALLILGWTLPWWLANHGHSTETGTVVTVTPVPGPVAHPTP